jgi:hypothetical protein
MLQPSPQLRNGLVGLLFFCTAALPAWGQISLAPTALFINDRTSVGELFLTNTSNDAQEINLRLQFGYPVSDSTGTITMSYDDPVMQRNHGLETSVRIFPRRLVLQGNQSQTVRIQILPMPGRPDAMYWSRVIVSSNSVASDVGSDTTAIGARIEYVLEQSIPIFFKKGQQTTGVMVKSVKTERQDTLLTVIPNLIRQGNSPFLGTIGAELVNSNGDVVSQTEISSFLYFEEWRKLYLPIRDIPSGEYKLNLRFDTQRRDIAPTDLVQAPTQTHSVTITL